MQARWVSHSRTTLWAVKIKKLTRVFFAFLSWPSERSRRLSLRWGGSSSPRPWPQVRQSPGGNRATTLFSETNWIWDTPISRVRECPYNPAHFNTHSSSKLSEIGTPTHPFPRIETWNSQENLAPAKGCAVFNWQFLVIWINLKPFLVFNILFGRNGWNVVGFEVFGLRWGKG